MPNAIHVIMPYRHASTWVFDDPRVGLSQEPFMSGIPEMIDTMVAKIPNAEKGFRLLFASDPFPGYQVTLEKVREEYEGVWYRQDDNGEGWLCPALFLYFPEAPTRLYAKAEALQSEVANLFLNVDFTQLYSTRLRLATSTSIPSLRDYRLNPSSGKRMPQIVEMKSSILAFFNAAMRK